MIASVDGRVLALDEDSLVVGLGGLGVRVRVPVDVLASVRPGDEVLLLTHLHVREQELSLYGFAERPDLILFQQLLGVSGVGPKLALTTLSSMPADSLRLAIGQGQADIVARVPGIGKKTAQKIVLELKDKVGAWEDTPPELAALSEADAEVIDALTALGYSVVEAQRAVQGLPQDVTDVEERLRLALLSFG
ncbi:MAG: Holliday junction branch migration protein RuvA [Chloroflexota bacterium]|nr:Holliday junction branch migration protein RuvA [Chloroflexota bacterium]